MRGAIRLFPLYALVAPIGITLNFCEGSEQEWRRQRCQLLGFDRAFPEDSVLIG